MELSHEEKERIEAYRKAVIEHANGGTEDIVKLLQEGKDILEKYIDAVKVERREG